MHQTVHKMYNLHSIPRVTVIKGLSKIVQIHILCFNSLVFSPFSGCNNSKCLNREWRRQHWNESHSSDNIWIVKWLRTFYAVIHSNSYTSISAVPNYSSSVYVSMHNWSQVTQQTQWRMSVFTQNEITVYMYMIK